MDSKKCTNCGEVKSLAEYHKLKKGKFGRAAACKMCRSEYNKKHNQRPEVKEKMKAYRQLPQVKSYNRERMRKKRNSEEFIEKERNYGRDYRKRPEVIERIKLYNQIEEVKTRKRVLQSQNRQRPEVKEKMKAYRQLPEVKERMKHASKRYRKKPSVKKAVSKKNKIQAEELTDYYLSKILYIQSGGVIKYSEAPPELIELKRNSLKLKRLIKQQKNE